MKKFLVFGLMLMVLGVCGVSFVGCGSNSVYFVPEISTNAGITVEHKTNMEEDFDFEIDGKKLDHSIFENEKLFSYAWILKDAGGNYIGWIEVGNGYDTLNGKIRYGIVADCSNGKSLHFEKYDFRIVLLDREVSVFEGLTIESNVGSFEHYTDVPYFDTDSGYQGRNAAVSIYNFNLEDVDPNTVETIQISLTFQNM